MKSLILSTLFLVGCMSTRKIDNTVQYKATNFPLELPASLESHRDQIKTDIIEAHKRIDEFSKEYDWQPLTEKPFIKKAEVFDSKIDFDQTAINLTNAAKDTKLPSSFVGGLEQEVLITVTPKMFKDLVPSQAEEGYYKKLVAHEIGHRLHIRILKGNEEAMGPIWFFEGFAVVAAGQFKDFTLPTEEIYKVIEGKERSDYRTYGAAVRYFMTKATLPKLVSKAGDKDFIQWLKSL